MAINKTKAAPRRTMTAARKLALASVAPAAFNEGASRAAVISAVLNAHRAGVPIEAIRADYIAGRFAAKLPSNGSEADRLAGARALMAMGGAGGTGSLKKGQTGRRNPEQERIYASARVLWSGILRDAGLKTTEKRGAQSKGRAKVQPKKPANNNKPASPKCKDVGQLVRYGMTQAAALLATVNKNAKIVPPAFSSAVQDFHAAMKKLAD